MRGGVGRFERHRRDVAGAVRVALERGVPEVLRPVLLADEEAGFRGRGIRGKGEREGDLDSLPFGRRPRRGRRTARSRRCGRAKRSASAAASRLSSTSIEMPSRLSSASRTKAPKLKRRGSCAEIAAGSSPSVMSSRNEVPNWISRFSVPQGWRLRAPTSEAQPRVERGRGVEIAHADDEMIDASCHGIASPACRTRSDQRPVIGASSPPPRRHRLLSALVVEAELRRHLPARSPTSTATRPTGRRSRRSPRCGALEAARLAAGLGDAGVERRPGVVARRMRRAARDGRESEKEGGGEVTHGGRSLSVCWPVDGPGLPAL